MLFCIQNKYFRRNNMTNATKRILEKKAQVEAKRNIHDVAAATVDNERKNAEKQDKEYSFAEANRDRMNALLAMQGINRDDKNSIFAI